VPTVTTTNWWSRPPTAKGQRLLAKADAAVDARLADIAGRLDDPAATERAMDGLELWRTAMRAYGESRAART
jgi:hypothetical protein